MFSGRPSVSASVRPCVQAFVPKSLSACFIRTKRRKFHQTLVDDVVEAKDELIRF